MKDKELDALEIETDKEKSLVINALIRLLNAMTDERNYYAQKCEELLTKEEEK